MTLSIVNLMMEGTLSADAVLGADASLISRAVATVGLESAHDLVALLSPEQLLTAIDDDAWSLSDDVHHEDFDGARFVTWLEVLAYADPRIIADRLSRLDEDFLVMALGTIFVVLTEEQWNILVASAPRASGYEKRLDAAVVAELGEYIVLSRIREAPRALESLQLFYGEDRPYADYLLERMSELSFERLSLGLESGVRRSRQDALGEDVASDRDARRTKRGFAVPAEARAWLQGLLLPAVDPIRLDALVPSPRREIVAVREAPESATLAGLRELAAASPEAADSIPQELARLANIVAAGVRAGDGLMSAVDAAAATLALCALALDDARRDGRLDAAGAAALLRERGLEPMFVAGWRLVHGIAAGILADFGRRQEHVAADGMDWLAALRSELPTDPFARPASTERFIRSRAQAARIANDLRAAAGASRPTARLSEVNDART